MNLPNLKSAVFACGSLLAMLLVMSFAGCASDGANKHTTMTAGLSDKNVRISDQTADVRTNSIASGIVDLRNEQAQMSAQAPGFEMRIESVPANAQVVVDDTPVAKTPCRVVLSGSPTGFFLEAHSIKVRFVAFDKGGQSQTVEESFTRHDKIPETLRFTSNGAERVLRK